VGDTSQAHQALSRSLEEQQQRLAEYPVALPEVRRIEAEAHDLLGQPARAGRALDEAVAADSSALERTDDPGEKAEIHWSLALSAEAAGRPTEAFRHAAAACRLTDNRVLHDRIQHWAEELREIEETEKGLDPCEELRDPT
jgi:tetratricopeptide (TPR) repeat protein